MKTSCSIGLTSCRLAPAQGQNITPKIFQPGAPSKNKFRSVSHWALSAVTASVVFAAHAEENAVKDATPKIERIALFKNGLGYATATATLPEKTKTVRIGQLPVPSYGTFWVGYSKDVKLRSLVSGMEDVAETVPVQNVAQLLRLNEGRKVVLTVGTGMVEGVVLKMPAPPKPVDPPNPYFMEVRRPGSGYGGYNPYYSGYQAPLADGIFMVKTDKGTVALTPGSVSRVDFPDGGIVNTTTNQQKRPSIRMELEKAAGGEKVSISYLARGITWVPGYRIDLSDEKTAKFSAQAQIINELADFEDAQIDLVTGFPNIQFAELPNPVAMSQDLANFLKSLESGRAESGGRGNMMSQQAMIYNNSYSGDIGVTLPSYAITTKGEVAEDLFLYPIKKFSLKKGETATVPLFTGEMPYKHMYTWKIGDQLDQEENNRRNNQRGEGKSAEEVWHVCRLINTAKMPLTTAAATFVKDGQFTGQDTCFYTAAGAEATIRINRAMNVQAEQAEVEVERKRNAANFNYGNHDLVKLTGELKIRNRLDKPVSMEITKELSGEVLDKTDDARDVQTAKGLKQVNPKHILTWNIELKPGEERKLTYTYQLYIRN